MKQENEHGVLRTLLFRPVGAKAAHPGLEALRVFVFSHDAEEAIETVRSALKITRDDWTLARISEEKDSPVA